MCRRTLCRPYCVFWRSSAGAAQFFVQFLPAAAAERETHAVVPAIVLESDGNHFWVFSRLSATALAESVFPRFSVVLQIMYLNHASTPFRFLICFPSLLNADTALFPPYPHEHCFRLIIQPSVLMQPSSFCVFSEAHTCGLHCMRLHRFLPLRFHP